MPRGDGDGKWREGRETEVTDRKHCRRGTRLTHAASPAKRVSSMSFMLRQWGESQFTGFGDVFTILLKSECRRFGDEAVL